MKRITKNLSVIAICIALLAGCANNQQPLPPLSRIILNDQVTMSISTDQQEYFSYEPVFITVSFRNISNKPVESFTWGFEFEAYEFSAVANDKDKLPSTSHAQALLQKADERRRSRVLDRVSGPLIIDLAPGKTYTRRIPLQEFVDLSGLKNTTVSVQVQRFGVTSNKINFYIRSDDFDLYDRYRAFYVKNGLNKRFPAKPAQAQSKTVKK